MASASLSRQRKWESAAGGATGLLKYEAGMSKYWTGRYRDRIAVNIEHVHKKVVKPA